jgi:hypothetical protein
MEDHRWVIQLDIIEGISGGSGGAEETQHRRAAAGSRESAGVGGRRSQPAMAALQGHSGFAACKVRPDLAPNRSPFFSNSPHKLLINLIYFSKFLAIHFFLNIRP